MKNLIRHKKSLLFWINTFFIILLGLCAAVLLIFYSLSTNSLRNQETENQEAILKLNVDSINASLASLENYLYQAFSNSEEITYIETGTDESKRFMAEQSISRSLVKIAGWNTSLRFLFFYSPGSPDRKFIRVSASGGDINEKDILQQRVTDYIDNVLEVPSGQGKSYFLINTGTQGYVMRFFRTRNSYIGMCLTGATILEPLEEVIDKGKGYSYISDTKGNIIYSTLPEETAVDLSKSGKIVLIDGNPYLQLGYLSGDSDFYIGTFTGADTVYRQTARMERLIFAFIAAILLLLAGLTLAIRKSLYRPIRKMEQSMKKVGSGDWNLVVNEESQILEYDSMIHNFNEMVSEIKDLKIENYEKKIAAQKAFLQYLQLQVNPHFYLNALNIIYSLAQVQDYEMIQKLTMALVQYSRYTFRKPDAMVTVQQEIEHVENYISIQQIRFPGKILFTAKISTEAEDAVIPPFIIQTFVENSVKYAVSEGKQNKITVRGTLLEIGEDLSVKLEIRDNGPGYSSAVLEHMQADGWSPDNKGNQIVINNVMQRIRLVFGSKATMVLRNNGGAETVIIVPLRWEEGTDEPLSDSPGR